jgi:hypothetical protein
VRKNCGGRVEVSVTMFHPGRRAKLGERNRGIVQIAGTLSFRVTSKAPIAVTVVTDKGV